MITSEQNSDYKKSQSRPIGLLSDKYMCSRFLLVLFQYKFHQKGSTSQCAAISFVLPQKAPLPTEFPFSFDFVIR